MHFFSSERATKVFNYLELESVAAEFHKLNVNVLVITNEPEKTVIEHLKAARVAFKLNASVVNDCIGSLCYTVPDYSV